MLGIFRQNYLRVSQSERVVEVPGAGALRLTRAPEGSGRAALRSAADRLRFTSRRGITGTLDLGSGKVAVDSSSGGAP